MTMYAPEAVEPGTFDVVLSFSSAYDASGLQSGACGSRYQCLLAAKAPAAVVAGSLQVRVRDWGWSGGRGRVLAPWQRQWGTLAGAK